MVCKYPCWQEGSGMPPLASYLPRSGIYEMILTFTAADLVTNGVFYKVQYF